MWWAAPMCTCTGAHEPSAVASGSSVMSASKRSEHSAMRGSTIQLPRAISSLATPARFSARRWPARPSSAGWPWAWIARTRACCPPGASCTRSPGATRPASAVPVMTVPWPDTVNTRSTPRRNRRSSLRPGSAAASRPRCSSSAATPGSPGLAAAVRKTGAPANGVPSSRAATSFSTSISRASFARSALVNATQARRTPSSSRIARCSRVCGMMPSSAATTSRARSIPVTPEAMVRMNFSCPGTSITPSVSPPGSGA